jgi:hypothetical protein
VDSAGNVYVADDGNREIRKVTPSGVVTTLAGSAGQAGSNNGAGTAARFFGPLDVAADRAGNVYVGDEYNDEVRKISPASLVGGDTPAFSETYNTKNPGTGLTLTPSGSVNDGNGGHNYAVTLVSNDGTTSAAATPTVAGLEGSDTVTGLSETYDTALPGTGKTLTVSSGYTVNDGDSGNNYAVTTVVNTTGVINAANTTTSLVTSSGSVVYGTPVTFTAIVSAGAGTLTPAQGSVDFKDTTTNTDFGNGTFAGSSGTSSTWTFTTGVKTFNVTTGDSIQASYSPGAGFAASSCTTTQAVTARPITVTAAANTKTYDGTASSSATPTTSPGSLIAGDTPAFTETYNTKNAGTGLRLTPTGSVNDGNGGGNYTVTTVASTAGVINQAPLTITAAANTKTYDGTTSAAATPTVVGLVGSDTVTGLSESYADKNAGLGKTLNVASYSVNDGNRGGNYAVTTVANTAGVINQAPLTITAAANTKVYDGTTSAAATPKATGLVGGDTVTGLSETYNNRNVGSGKTLTVGTGYVVNDGNGGGNYAVTTATSTAGVINQAGLTIAAAANTKTYDGTTSAAATPTVVGLEGSDTVTGLSETYDSKNAGSGKTLAVATGYVVNDGNGGGNYTVTTVTSTAGVIDQAGLTITAAANTKSGKTLTVAGSVNDGNGGNNYAVTFVTNSTGLINQAGLTITAVADTKTTTARPARRPHLRSAAAAWPPATRRPSPRPSTQRTQARARRSRATGSVNDGNSGNNYTVTFAVTTTGSVTARPSPSPRLASTKVYDGATSSAVTPTITGGSLATGDTAAFTETFNTRRT